MGRKPAVPSTVLVNTDRKTRVVINHEQGYLLVNRDGCPSMQNLDDFDFVSVDMMIRFYERRGYEDVTVSKHRVLWCVEPGCSEPKYIQPGGARMSRCKAHYAAYQLARYHAKKTAPRPDGTDPSAVPMTLQEEPD